MEQEVLFKDLTNICVPKENIAHKRIRSKWSSYYYETGSFSGNMLISPYDGRPQPIYFEPKLSGWYSIYVGLYNVLYVSGGAGICY